MTDTAYVLGHSEFELKRLARQAQLLAPATTEYFYAAGMAPGMRVLDVGSGTGDVAFLAADVVGRSGEVVGTDIAAPAIESARESTIARSLAQVSFCQGNPVEMAFERPFDFVVGRFVLHHQANPSGMLRGLVRHLRPGGVILFHEPDWSFVHSEPAAPTYDRYCRWIIDVFDRARAGITNTGARMYQAFSAAGLPAPTMRMRIIIGDAVTASEWLHAVADIAIVMAGEMERQGIATSAEVGGGNIADKLLQDVASSRSVVIGRAEVGAWATV